MLNTLEISLLNNRIEKLKARRSVLLGLKKEERAGELKTVEKTISNIKRWLRQA